MATFGEVLNEIQDLQLRRQREGIADPIRRKYLRALHDLTGRNVVVYYSAFLQRQGPEHYFTEAWLTASPRDRRIITGALAEVSPRSAVPHRG